MDIDAVADRLDNGNPILVRELLLRNVEYGLDLRAACASVGLNAETLTDWRKRGAVARARHGAGRSLTEKEQRYADFARQVESAEIEAELTRVRVIDLVMRGGYPITKIVERQDLNGNVIERTVTTERAKPNWNAAAWWLTRRRPGYLERIEIVDPTKTVPQEDVAEMLELSLREFMQGVEAGRAISEEEAGL